MIRVNFKPDKIPGSLLLGADDLTKPSALAARLRDAPDKMSKHLQAQLPAATQALLKAYDGTVPPSAQLLDDMMAGLNQRLQGPSLYDKKLLRVSDLARSELIKGLDELSPQQDELLRLNRLVLEDIYHEEIAGSLRAEWDAWQTLAAAATKKVIGEWEAWRKNPGDPPVAFDPNPRLQPYIWKGIRDWLLEHVFHGKCAYCETYGVGYIADAEHFRPKAQVSAKSGKVKTLDVDGNREIEHPGYFWLAYHWQNLLPSCNTCNRYGGKKDQFPASKHVFVRRITDANDLKNLRHQITRSTVDTNVFFLEPDDLDLMEERELLHPYFDEPWKCISFKPTGEAMAVDGNKLGEASIKVYDLNQKDKVVARHRAQNADYDHYYDLVKAAVPDMEKMRRAAQVWKDDYYKGTRPYYAAVIDMIRVMFGRGGLLDPDVLLDDQPQEDADG